jgi:periplasmic copper chaperone A
MARNCTSLAASTQCAAITAPVGGIVMGRRKRWLVPDWSKEVKKQLLAALVLGLAPLASVAAGPADLSLDGAWVRALPPGQPNTAAYLTVTNHGAAAVTIVGACSAIAGNTQIHTTREVDGLQRMERVGELQVAPGQSLEFAPGGTHLMLMDLAQMPVPGDKVQLCLELAGDTQVCTLAEVRRGAGDQQSHEHHQH